MRAATALLDGGLFPEPGAEATEDLCSTDGVSDVEDRREGAGDVGLKRDSVGDISFGDVTVRAPCSSVRKVMPMNASGVARPPVLEVLILLALIRWLPDMSRCTTTIVPPILSIASESAVFVV
jgi:hypothetical protein